MAFYLLQENGDKITLEDGSGFLLLEDAPIPPPTIYYQSDGKGSGKRARRRRRQTDALFQSIENTLRATLDGPAVVAAPVTEAAPGIDVSHGFERALDQLTLLAREHEELSTRVESLRRAVQVFEAKKAQEILDDDEEIWMLM